MTSVREAWTDERLDDLNGRVSEGFADVRAELRAEIGSVRGEIGSVRSEIGSVRGEIANLRKEMRIEFAAVRGEFDSVRGEIASLQRTMIYCFFSLTTLMLTGFIAIGTQL
jgi:predicted  nucleic acid-binding Zn-ribbon protein